MYINTQYFYTNTLITPNNSYDFGFDIKGNPNYVRLTYTPNTFLFVFYPTLKIS